MADEPKTAWQAPAWLKSLASNAALVVGTAAIVGLVVWFQVSSIVNPPAPIPVNPDVKPVDPTDKNPVTLSYQINGEGEFFAVTDKGVKCAIGDVIDFKARTIGKSITWDWLTEEKFQVRYTADALTFFAARAGVYRLGASTAIKDTATKLTWARVTVGDPAPDPQPKPPDPKPPDPKPPDPPKPITGLRVIFVAESSSNMTKEQLNIWNSTRIADYLNRKTVKTDGRPGWRKWDPDINVSNETETWKQIWAATKGSLGALPALVIVDGVKGEVFPWPPTEQEALDFLKKKGGE